MKNECTRRLLVPYQRESVRRELALYLEWYNGHRPHEALRSATPDEIYFDRDPASESPRIEPRRRWPRGSPCASPQAAVRGIAGQVVELKLSSLSRRMHLPIVELKRAA